MPPPQLATPWLPVVPLGDRSTDTPVGPFVDQEQGLLEQMCV